MKTKNFKFIITLITLIILATIGLQVYWNIKNYHENKRQFVIEVVNALDNGIESYYIEDAKNNFIAFVSDSTMKTDSFIDKIRLDTFFNNKGVRKEKAFLPAKKSINHKKTDSIYFKKDSIQIIVNEPIKTTYKSKIDTSKKIQLNDIRSSNLTSISVFKGKKDTDSILKIKDIANKIVISMIKDSIDFNKLSYKINQELKRKNILVDYSINHLKSNKQFDQFTTNKKAKLSLEAKSKSIYLPQHQQLKLKFSNPVLLILKRSLVEITLSFLMSLSIIGSLVFLLKVIQQQKKLDEIKNDLIGNITHEFKTPITTIATAIEGIKCFNSENDVEKTNRYLNISSLQLQKLETMVERLLETASLDTDQLSIKKEKTDLLPLLLNCIEKHQLNNPEKSIELKSNFSELEITIDSFHIENAISNLIDNAVKYGGNSIIILLYSDQKNTSICVEDNGTGIDKSLKERIFEKFYRIPKGNIHDVKGFGIGLFYSKKIIEKHGGSLELVSHCNPTLFKIVLSNEN